MKADLGLRSPVSAARSHIARVQPAWDARRILGVRIHACTYESATARIVAWAAAGESHAVACANVHVVMEARDDASFAGALESMDLVTPDGMPLVWGLRRLGVDDAERVYGPDLTREVCALAAAERVPVGFYGGAPEVVGRLVDALRAAHPDLDVRYAWSPPFRPLSSREDAEATAAIGASGARILFVGLGCPKQERWIAEHRSSIPAVLIGVGAAFDFLAGTKRQAPRVVQRMGLEWLFRLCAEPRRLWKRYAKHNPRFVVAFGRQLLRGSKSTGGEA